MLSRDHVFRHFRSFALIACMMGSLASVYGAQPKATAAAASASDLSGTWQATLASDRPARLLLKVTKEEDSPLSAVLYNIDRGPQPFAMSEFLVQPGHVEFALGSMSARFTGRLSGKDTLSGRWTQDGQSNEITFQRVAPEAAWEIPVAPTRKRVVDGSAAKYEVATVKLSNPNAFGSGLRVRGLRLEGINMSLSDLIQFAYELQASQLVNTPDWGDHEKFDIDLLFNGDQYPDDAQCKAMVKQLLAERFALTLHREDKELSIYSLTVGKSQPKMTKSEGDPNGLPGIRLRAPGVLGAQNATMTDFTQALQRLALDRPVIDQTGLSGRWDFGLKWMPEKQQAETELDARPDLFTAVREQLGLQLAAVKFRTKAFTIDHVEKPSEN